MSWQVYFKSLNLIILSLIKQMDLNSSLPYEEELKKIEQDFSDANEKYLFPHFLCKVDNINKVNIIYVKSKINECIYACTNILFDKNNYPIIIIFDKQNEKNDMTHYKHISSKNFSYETKLFIDFISPLISVKYFEANKVNETTKKIKINLDNNITYYLSEPFYSGYDDRFYRDDFIKEKIEIKNKRKPTDILIYTDGTLLSQNSLFIKYFQYYGGGIVAGYFGNPNKRNIPFDSGQSIAIF